jgi:hypothetical protein
MRFNSLALSMSGFTSSYFMNIIIFVNFLPLLVAMPLQESECSTNVGMIGAANQWSGIAVQWEQPCFEQKVKLRYGIQD